MRDVRLVFSALLATLALAASAAAAGPVYATLSTTSKQPVADTPWRYTIVVKDQAGKPLAARVRLQLLRQARVVSCWKSTAMVRCSGTRTGTWISFKGKRTGVIRWPAKSAGVKFTFLATVIAATQKLELRAPLTVRLP
jgi:hypothetical protein